MYSPSVIINRLQFFYTLTDDPDHLNLLAFGMSSLPRNLTELSRLMEWGTIPSSQSKAFCIHIRPYLSGVDSSLRQVHCLMWSSNRSKVRDWQQKLRIILADFHLKYERWFWAVPRVSFIMYACIPELTLSMGIRFANEHIHVLVWHFYAPLTPN